MSCLEFIYPQLPPLNLAESQFTMTLELLVHTGAAVTRMCPQKSAPLTWFLTLLLSQVVWWVKRSQSCPYLVTLWDMVPLSRGWALLKIPNWLDVLPYTCVTWMPMENLILLTYPFTINEALLWLCKRNLVAPTTQLNFQSSVKLLWSNWESGLIPQSSKQKSRLLPELKIPWLLGNPHKRKGGWIGGWVNPAQDWQG